MRATPAGFAHQTGPHRARACGPANQARYQIAQALPPQLLVGVVPRAGDGIQHQAFVQGVNRQEHSQGHGRQHNLLPGREA